ncbi:Eukaryotic translation initiation factor 4E type 2 [Dissophora globulifera]|uniref:Eukaryotic translation initiation factor 4E type 2 n=1 Tax=Dissophora globulifera TaxID=979702 RepID=A0A9P6UTQ0_9FUNG|nr:Eukaryotic translation initiation factor 4E type 2 [Dissophora globulifera]
MQRGGLLFDRVAVGLSTSRYIPQRILEVSIFLAEVYLLNVPEWILGEKYPSGVPSVEKRIASSIATSRLMIAETVAKGGRRKVAVLTGGASGLGYMAAMAIAEAGYHLIIGDRATEIGMRAVETIKDKTGNTHVEFLYLDLGSFKDVREFAAKVAMRATIIDLLINNAGVMDLPNFRPTVEGHDSQFGINHLGHYFLTHLLLPLVKAAPKARIVMTASSAHYGTSKINYPGITSAKAYDRINNYCGSKLATVMFVRHLAQSLKQSGNSHVTVNCLHPGACHTGLFSHSWLLYILTRIGLQYLLRSPTRGARTILYLGFSEEVEGISGEYWFDERIRRRNPASADLEQQKKLINLDDMDSAWGSRKSITTPGGSSGSGGSGVSKLVQLQRQSSSIASATAASTAGTAAAISSSAPSLFSTVSATTTGDGHDDHPHHANKNSRATAGRALDVSGPISNTSSKDSSGQRKSSKEELGPHTSKIGAAGVSLSGNLSSLKGEARGKGVAGSGSASLSKTTTMVSAAARPGTVSNYSSSSSGGGGSSSSSGHGGSGLHPLHFNWVFWFMHRAPGTKILNYDSSMKKIATFGSVEDFWAVYSHLIRPHELPAVSDYHLFKQGIRPVWEDAANIKGGKWIVRLKKGLASRYWEDLVMAVIGDQFNVGDEICGVVLSIRSTEDILSLWNQSADEGRLNLTIRDTMKRVLNLPADTTMEYKTHNDALKDKSSFRNTDIFR